MQGYLVGPFPTVHVQYHNMKILGVSDFLKLFSSSQDPLILCQHSHMCVEASTFTEERLCINVQNQNQSVQSARQTHLWFHPSLLCVALYQLFSAARADWQACASTNCCLHEAVGMSKHACSQSTSLRSWRAYAKVRKAVEILAVVRMIQDPVKSSNPLHLSPTQQ